MFGNDMDNEENTVHEGEQDAGDIEDKDSNSISKLEEIRANEIEGESIKAAERLSQEHASKHVPQLGMTFTNSEEAYTFCNDYGYIVGFLVVRLHIQVQG